MEDSQKVYITHHGRKYHNNKNCSTLYKNPSLITLSLIEAKAKKKSPCKVCYNNNNNFNYNNKYNNYNNKYNNNKYFYKKKFEKKNIPNNFINSDDADDEIFDSKNYTKIEQNITNEKKEEEKKEEEKKENFEDNNLIKEEGKTANNLEDINIYSIDNIDKKMLNEITVSSISNYDLLKNNLDKDKYIKKNIEEEKFTNNINKEESKNMKNNINNEKSKNIASITNQKNISKKIQKLIEKDKKRYNEINEYYERQNGNELSIEDKNNNVISDDIINSDSNESKSSDSSSESNIIIEQKPEEKNSIEISDINSKENFLSPMNFSPLQQCYVNQYLSLKINNQNYNNYNIKLNIQKNDMSIMSEIYNNATILSFEKNILNENIYDSQINGKGLSFKDMYMFKFEISPLKGEEIKNFMKIEIGVKIKYINIQDINLIIDEQLMDKKNINFKIGSLYDSLIIKKKLLICKRTGIIYALININKGKFFITGKEELEKRKLNIFLNKTNTETFFIKNFTPIAVSCVKNIEPIFNYNKNYLKNFEIKINDKILNN